MPRRAEAPPMHFDGVFHWYTEWFSESDDRCCYCRGPIAEESVPLILWKDVGHQTWMARFCETCTPRLLARLGG